MKDYITFTQSESDGKPRCYGCGDKGHMQNECNKKGLIKCYECNRFTTHIAADCTIRLARLEITNGRKGNKNDSSNKFLHAKNKHDFKRKYNKYKFRKGQQNRNDVQQQKIGRLSFPKGKAQRQTRPVQKEVVKVNEKQHKDSGMYTNNEITVNSVFSSSLIEKDQGD